MTVYTGNVVPYGSGGHWYARVTVTDDGPTSNPTTGLHITSQVVFENSISDNMNTSNGSDPLGAWSANNLNAQGAGTYTVQQRDFQCGILEGGSNARIVMNADGFAGTGPSVIDVLYPMPGRLSTATVPTPPRNAGVDQITQTTARGLYNGSENNGGSLITHYVGLLRRISDGADLWSGNIGVSGAWVMENLTRYTGYRTFYAAVNGVGASGWSGPYDFYTLPDLPGPPGQPVMSSITGTSAVASFTAPLDNGGQTIVSYDVEYSQDPTFATGVTTQPTGTLTGLTPGTPYSVRVRARNNAGPGPYSPVTTFTTGATGIRYWNGSTFVAAPVLHWNGSAFIADEVRVYNGTAWVPSV